MAEVEVPALPQLAPWLTVVRLGDGRIDLRATNFNYSLRQEMFVEAFNLVEPLLDGHHDVDAITRFGREFVDEAIISFLLKLLVANSCLFDATPDLATNEIDPTHHEQTLYLSRFTARSNNMQMALKSAHVRVLGDGALASIVIDQLVQCGVGRVSDVSLDAKADRTQRAREVVAAGALLGVVCLDSADHQLLNEVNEASMVSGVRWLRSVVAGPLAYLGPTVVPHQSSCYRCFDLRWQAHLLEVDSYLAYQNVARPSSEGALLPHTSLLAANTTLEVLRLLTGFSPPTTIGRFHEFSVTSPGSTVHSVLKLPRCPACGRSEIAREVWARDSEASFGEL